jgi:NADH dehydrogenase FAD-containing subunit
LIDRSITEPVRRVLRGKNVRYYEAECTAIDPSSNIISCKGGIDTFFFSTLSWKIVRDFAAVQPATPEEAKTFTIPYDKLVVAVGAVNKYDKRRTEIIAKIILIVYFLSVLSAHLVYTRIATF